MNEKTNINYIIQRLGNHTGNYSIGQITAELHVVVERLEFIKFDPKDSDARESLLGQISYLFERDVSKGMMSFLTEMIDEGELEMLLGQKGRELIGYCEHYFGEKRQVIFKTPVLLSREQQNTIQMKLMNIFPVNARVVFEVDPGVGTGFVMSDNGRTVADYSLRSKMVKLLQRRVRERLQL